MTGFEIQNYDKFQKRLEELIEDTENINIKTFAEEIGVHPTAVSKWLNGTYPSTDNLNKILNKYKEIPIEQFGVIVYEVKESYFGKRLKELLEEYGMKQQDLADELKFSKGQVSSWISGRNKPEKDNLEKIANYFDVSIAYLMGLTEEKNSEKADIEKLLGIDDRLYYLLLTDNADSPAYIYGKETTAGKLGEKYFDLKNYIYGDGALLSVLKDEVDRLISYCESDEYYSKYEDFANYKEIESQAIGNLNNYPIYRMAHDHINYVMDEIFDKYVNKELIARNLGTNLYDTINNRGMKYIENKKNKKLK